MCYIATGEDGRFNLTILDDDLDDFRVTSVELKLKNNRTCAITTPLPLYIRPDTKFKLEGVCPNRNDLKDKTVDLCLGYDTLSEGGEIKKANISDCGKMSLRFGGNDITNSIPQLEIALILVTFVVLLIKYETNKKMILGLLIALLLFMLAILALFIISSLGTY
jgi:hypothetical protein